MRQTLRWSLPVVVVLSGVALAQDVQILPAPARPPVPGGGPEVNVDSMYGKESAQGVYVRDSAVALEKFAQAQRMEHLKEWAKAADLYQEVLEKFADRVVPSQVDKDNAIYQYISVIAAVQQKMSKWPAEGLEVYRQRYETAAQSIMDGAKVDDRTAMQTVLNRYFPTETAKTAGMRLMDLYLESGEFAAAAWMGEQLLAGHPNLIVERPRVLYRAALAYHLAGDAERSKAKVEELKARYPEETGTVRGTDTRLVDSLASEISQGTPKVQTLADSAWPMFGGSVDHARISTAQGRPGAKVYSVELSKPNYNTGNREVMAQLKAADQADQDSGATLGVMPVIDKGEMYFQDGMKLYAVSVESGHPLPGWDQTYPGDRKGQYQLAGASRYTPRGQLLTVTLTDNAVLAIMGQSDRRAAQYGIAAPAQGEGRLVCLDRATGKEKWVFHPRTLPDEASALRNADLNGAPLVVDNNVYVAARSGRGNQFEDCYLLCFDLDSGKYKWNCYIASANSINQAAMMGFWDGESPIGGQTIAQLAYSSGRLYVLTNLGALAAVDAYGGRIVWLSIYPRNPAITANNPMMARRMMMGGMGGAGSTDKPWESNPVIVDNGRVFVLPGDGRFIHVYDAGAGVEIKRLDSKHFDDASCLLAVDGEKLIVTGKESVQFVNWPKYDAETFAKAEAEDGPNPLTQKKGLPYSIRGRAFVANGMVYLPTTDKLYVVRIQNPRVLQEYPQAPKSWQREESEGPGNVIVSDDHVILAANRRIDVYTDMDAARRKLDARIVANPGAPEPRLEYAEVMFVAGDVDSAIQKLDEAIELLGGQANMKSGPARDRLFKATITFADKLGRDIKDKSHENVKTVLGLYDRAAVAASNPSQQVRYRMERAQLETTIGNHPQAVKLYQEIIADAELRPVPALDEATNVQSGSGLVARKAIDHIIRTHGAAPYAVFEQQAAAELEKATATGSSDDLVNVATVYPNAKVAPQALLAAADVRDAGGDPRGAVQLLRQLYLSYPNFKDKRRVLESLARNYLALPNRTSVAIARLSEAAKLGGNEKLAKPILLPNGKQVEGVTLNQALAELKKVRGQEVARTLPDFRLPVPPSYVNEQGIKTKRQPFVPETPDLVVAEVAALLVPHRDFARPDRIAYYARGQLNIAAPGQARPLAQLPIPEQPAGITWTSAGPLVWTSKTATLLRGDSSTAAWTFDTKALVSVEVVAAVPTQGDNTDTDQPAANPDGDEVFVGNIRQQVIINRGRRMMVVNGQIREIPPDAMAAKIALGANETIVSARPVGDMVLFTTSSGRIVSVELSDGQIRWQTRVADRLPERIAADEDFTVLWQRDDQSVTITVLDSFTGQTVGRRYFGIESGRMPFNFALSPDGTLVYTLMDRIVLKNLYEPWTAPDREIVDARAAQTGNPPYMTSTQPEQLQVVDGRILVIADQGTKLRVFSMETAKPLRYTPAGSKQETDMVLTTTARNNEQVQLRTVGSQVYLVGPRTLMSYNLDKPEQSWSMYVDEQSSSETIADTFVGREHIVVLRDTKKKINAGQVAGYRLLAQSRSPISETEPGESGRQDYKHLITDPSGIKSVQAVDGGFYYLAADQKLHFLKSAPAN